MTHTKNNSPLSPEEWMEERGIDTDEIVAYYVKDGVGDGVDIDLFELLREYAAHVASYVQRPARHRAAHASKLEQLNRAIDVQKFLTEISSNDFGIELPLCSLDAIAETEQSVNLVANRLTAELAALAQVARRGSARINCR